MKMIQTTCLRAVKSIALLVAILVAQKPARLMAQTLNCAPYSSFQAMSAAQLATLQVKLTFAGSSKGLLPSVAFTGLGNTYDATLFSPCQRSGLVDPSARVNFATTSDLAALITNVATLPTVTAGGASANPFLSFSLANSQPSKVAFEAVLDQPTTVALFSQLRASFADNKSIMLVLSKLGCSLGTLEAGVPTDVSGGFSVALSGLRLKRPTNTYVSVLTVTNNSASTPSAPLSVVLDLPINVTIVNPDGVTCQTSPQGRGFINLSSIPAPGKSVSVPVEFTNPDQEPVTFKTRILAGPGAR